MNGTVARKVSAWITIPNHDRISADDGLSGIGKFFIADSVSSLGL